MLLILGLVEMPLDDNESDWETLEEGRALEEDSVTDSEDLSGE